MVSKNAYWSNKNEHALNTYSEGSIKKGLWVCDHGHEWTAEIRKVLKNNTRCPYCSNKKLLKNFNDFQTIYPNLLKYFDKNNTISPSDLLATTNKVTVSWSCPKCSHSWVQTPFFFVRKKHPCSSCKGIVDTDVNNIHNSEYLFPVLLNEKDGKIFANHRKKKIDWVCTKGHIYSRTPYDVQRTPGCPVCKGVEIVPGVNDLATINPDLADEWHDERSIETIAFKSSHNATWKCSKCSNVWKTPVYNRTGKKKTGCPKCNQAGTSRMEQDLAKFVEKLLPNHEILRNSKKVLKSGKELDVYIPSLSIALEFNGDYWHSHEILKDKYYHFNKYIECRDLDIDLLQIWEHQWINDNSETKALLSERLSEGFSENFEKFSQFFDVFGENVLTSNDFAVDRAMLKSFSKVGVLPCCKKILPCQRVAYDSGVSIWEKF